MDDEDDYMGLLRYQALTTIGDNVVALGLPPATETFGVQPDEGSQGLQSIAGALGDQPGPLSGMEGGEGAFEVALGPKSKAWVQERMRASGADQGFDRTLNRMTGGQFKPDEIKTLEDRALAAASWPDVFRMTGIGEGPPVVMTAGQKATTDRLMRQMGSDDLAARARAAYEKAVSGGQIRIR